jgi:hypothetical protein
MLVRKTEGERPVMRPRCRQKNDIKIDVKKIGLEGMDYIHLAQDRDP